MKDKLVCHIRENVEDSSIDDVSDSVIESIMTATFDFVSENCEKCFYCQNFNQISLFSLCKIHHHIQPDCFSHTINVDKMMRKNYDDIIILANESMMDCGENKNSSLTSHLNKKIIHKSVELYELIKHENCINQ